MHTPYRGMGKSSQPMNQGNESCNKSEEKHPPENTGYRAFLFVKFCEPVGVAKMEEYMVCNQKDKQQAYNYMNPD